MQAQAASSVIGKSVGNPRQELKLLWFPFEGLPPAVKAKGGIPFEVARFILPATALSFDHDPFRDPCLRRTQTPRVLAALHALTKRFPAAPLAKRARAFDTFAFHGRREPAAEG
jgi:hypothetical protein